MERCLPLFSLSLLFVGSLILWHPTRGQDLETNEAAEVSNIFPDRPTQHFLPSDRATVQQRQNILHLCHPQGLYVKGFEGLPPEGLVLDKVFILLTSARHPTHHPPLPNHPPPPVHCRFPLHALQSSSPKVRSYPEVSRDARFLLPSKAGLRMFDVVTDSERCREGDVSPASLSGLIRVGEFLGRRYGETVPWLSDPGKDVTAAFSLPEKDYYQSASAFLHGLLQEKQFMRAGVKKLDRHAVRDLGSHCWCSNLSDIDSFMEEAYRAEREIFKLKSSNMGGRSYVKSDLLFDSVPAKDLVGSLYTWFCDAGQTPCNKGGCSNVTETDLDLLLQSVASHNSYLSSNDLFKSYAETDTFLFFEKLKKWFAVVRDDRIIKVDLADDFFFLKVLASLGLDVQQAILPASRLVIEQYYKLNSKSEAKYWRVLLDGMVVTDRLAACSLTASKGFCGVDTIAEYMKLRRKLNEFGDCVNPREEL